MSKRTREPLPNPSLIDGAGLQCLGCGYDLSGLDSGLVCPECGLKRGPDLVLRIVGLPKYRETRIWRRVAWGLIIAGGVIFSQLWPMILFSFHSAALVVTVLLLLILSCVAMFLTGRRGGASTEQIVFTWAGIGRKGWGSEQAQTELMTWPEKVAVHTSSVSKVWQKLRIDAADPKKRRFFECGFRCERERLAWVENSVRVIAAGGEAMDEQTDPVDQSTGAAIGSEVGEVL